MATELAVIKRPIGASAYAVDARNLHARLGTKKDFSDWVKLRIGQLYLQENIDFAVFSETPNQGYRENTSNLRPKARIDYVFTAESATRVLMAENTEAGREVQAELSARIVAMTSAPMTPKKGLAAAREARLQQQADTARRRAETDAQKADLARMRFQASILQKALSARYLPDCDKVALQAKLLECIGIPSEGIISKPTPKLFAKTTEVVATAVTPPPFDDTINVTPLPTPKPTTAEYSAMSFMPTHPAGWLTSKEIAIKLGNANLASNVGKLAKEMGAHDGHRIPDISFLERTWCGTHYEKTRYYSPNVFEPILDGGYVRRFGPLKASD